VRGVVDAQLRGDHVGVGWVGDDEFAEGGALGYIVLGAGVVDFEGLGEETGCRIDFLAVLGEGGVGGEGGLAQGLGGEVGVGDGFEGFTGACCGCLGCEGCDGGGDEGQHCEGGLIASFLPTPSRH